MTEGGFGVRKAQEVFVPFPGFFQDWFFPVIRPTCLCSHCCPSYSGSSWEPCG